MDSAFLLSAWILTIIISAVISLITSVYGLSKSTGPLKERLVPEELLPYSKRDQCCFLIPIVNIVQSTIFLSKTIKYYNE